MALQTTSPHTPRNSTSWRSGSIREDLNHLKQQAALGDAAAIARLHMLETIAAQQECDQA